jgi:hypothetical protein
MLRLKFLLLFLSFCVFENTLHAQAFEFNQTIISAGYGFGPAVGSRAHTYLQNVYRTYSMDDKCISGPLFLKLEYAASSKIGLGLNVSFSKYHINYSNSRHSPGGALIVDSSENDFQTYSVFGRFNYHFIGSSHFDPYIGFSVGFSNGSFSNTPPQSTSEIVSPICFEFIFGGRFLISKHFGVFSEVGYAESIIQLGLAAKF